MLLQLNSLSSKVTATIASVPGEFSVLHSGPVLPGAAPFLHSLSHSFTQQVKRSPSIDAPSMLCKKKKCLPNQIHFYCIYFLATVNYPRVGLQVILLQVWFLASVTNFQCSRPGLSRISAALLKRTFPKPCCLCSMYSTHGEIDGQVLP